MVRVNTSTKVDHTARDKCYGNTKQGKFMTEADAKAQRSLLAAKK